MSGSYPSFTPFLLASPLIRNAPKALTEQICRHAMATMHRQHKAVFERVAERESFALLIAPTDLDLKFYLKIDPEHPELRPVTNQTPEPVAARIFGPLPALLELLQGKSDGDALFFSRTLRIEGRTDLVVALRNALDGEEIDLRSAVSNSFGIANPVARLMLGLAETLYKQLQHDMNRTAATLTSSIEKRLGGLEKRASQQTEALARLEKSVQRSSRRTQYSPAVSAKDDFALPDHK
ncbi:ubiquinone anaerobic biosynthesis accessory factor UbiT [Thalassospira sp. SM2505]